MVKLPLSCPEEAELNSPLWQPHSLYMKLGHNQASRGKRYQTLFKAHISDKELHTVRDAPHKSLALGNDRFKEEIEPLTGQRVTPLKRGRKRSQTD